MTESKVQYTTPDEVAARLGRMEAYIAQLENTCNGYLLIQHRHAEMVADRDRRIAELLEDRQMLQAQVDADRTIVADQAIRIVHLEATVRRLEQDNKRLHHLDAMPVDALERYFHNVSEVEEYAESREDFAAILAFLFPPVR